MSYEMHYRGRTIRTNVPLARPRRRIPWVAVAALLSTVALLLFLLMR